MSETECFEIPVKPDEPHKPEVRICLHHYTGPTDPAIDVRPPVLLLHGASANHRTFLTGEEGGLARSLARYRDVWLLDWRGSGLVVDDARNHPALKDDGEAFNFNTAAQYDLPAAIQIIRDHCNYSRVSALGFCMGAAVLAEAVALGHVTAADLDCLVLMTLGLFYETPVDGRLKGEDRILEKLKNQPFPPKEPFLFIDPRVAETKTKLKTPWPTMLDELYEHWPSALKSHEEPAALSGPEATPLDPVYHMCNRVSFMYGMPYHHGNLVNEIHGTASVKSCLPELFGAIPLHMYIHGARNIRQGHATSYQKVPAARPDADYVSDVARDRFRALDRVTLITGALNRLWHRDSIDRMYEWLRRGTSEQSDKFRKRVVQGYGHQDLLWGRNAPRDVFPKIREGLSS
jgi:cholesterol oxidase